MNEAANPKTTTALSGQVDQIVTRIKAIFIFILVAALFWLPLLFALKEPVRLALRWMTVATSREYAKWFLSLLTCVTVIKTGRKVGA